MAAASRAFYFFFLAAYLHVGRYMYVASTRQSASTTNGPPRATLSTRAEFDAFASSGVVLTRAYTFALDLALERERERVEAKTRVSSARVREDQAQSIQVGNYYMYLISMAGGWR